MKCLTCKDEMRQTTTTHFVDLKKCMIIIKNVPCLECPQCGEKYYTDEVAARLDEIVEKVSSIMTEIAVVEYTNSAA